MTLEHWVTAAPSEGAAKSELEVSDVHGRMIARVFVDVNRRDRNIDMDWEDGKGR